MLKTTFLKKALLFLAFGLMLVISIGTNSRAMACLPCQCTDVKDRGINCYGPYHIVVRGLEEVCTSIRVFNYDPNTKAGTEVIRVTAAALGKIPAKPETNTLIKQSGMYALYRLTTGEFQLNYGPDFEGKTYVTIWSACPPKYVNESATVIGT